MSKHYRPVRQEFETLPKINYNSKHGTCPFLTQTNDGRNAAENDDRAEVEERDGQDGYNRDTLVEGDSNLAKSLKESGFPAKSQSMQVAI